ncbi:MAG: inner membrane protein [Chitinophagales bacterium]|jgi:inner membrane protein
MDPVSQAVVGSAAAQSISKKQFVSAGILGCLGGMAPDLDVLIRSSTDPLLFLTYHRHFTHSLLFIPIGGLICALVLHQLIGKRQDLSFKQSYLYCTVGYATHALLDACTTYGTMLFWPFSDVRIAWNMVSVIDPLFTIPLLLLVIAATLKKNPWLARIALLWAVTYPSLGLLQHDRAIAVGYQIAQQRGHNPTRLEAKPSFGNILVWKVVYEYDQYFYVDAVRAGINTQIFIGDRAAKLDTNRDFPWLDKNSQQAKDIERFRWFSIDYLAIDPDNTNRVIDVRYSMVPNQIAPLWSIELSPSAKPAEHVKYLTNRDASDARLDVFKAMLFD